MRLIAQQKYDDKESLALLRTKNIFQEKRMLDFSSAMINLVFFQDEVNITRATVDVLIENKSSSGPRIKNRLAGVYKNRGKIRN